MSDLKAPESILTLLEAIRAQVDVITAISSVGLGTILLTWGRIFGFIKDADLSSFRQPSLLIIPAIALLCAVILGYMIGAQITGYFTEIAQGKSASGKAISDARAHYFSDYREMFDLQMILQFWASVAGIILFSLWFAVNFIGKMRAFK